MKTLTRKPFSLFLSVVLTLATAGTLRQSQAQIVTLLDANSTAQINFGNQAGMFNWVVDGQNQLNQQWFWFRVGPNGGEAPINVLGLGGLNQPAPNVVTATYLGAGFTVSPTYTLRGGLPGSGASDIGESIVINNTGAGPLDFHFFQYSDFRIAGTPGDDFTQLSASHITGLFNEAAVWDSHLILRENVDTTVSPGANHGEVAPVGATLAGLTDALPTTLNDNAGPLGPSYNTWALEWDLLIAQGGSVIISKDKNLQAVIVPEPSAGVLALVGLFACGLYRRSRRA